MLCSLPKCMVRKSHLELGQQIQGLATNHYSLEAKPVCPSNSTFPHTSPPCPQGVNVACLNGTKLIKLGQDVLLYNGNLNIQVYITSTASSSSILWLTHDPALVNNALHVQHASIIWTNQFYKNIHGQLITLIFHLS